VSASFPVSDVQPSTERLGTVPVATALQQATASLVDGAAGEAPPLEACSHVAGGLVAPGAHPVVTAVQLAFDRHLPLVLSPDDVWILLAQGYALHVRQHAEALRERFVRHDGQLELDVRRDDFVPGSPDNPWPEVFDALSVQLREHLGKRHDLIVADFSTTGPLERAVSQLVLMDAVERYFSYSCTSACGIPSVTLLGTPADWRSIQRRARVFGDFGLEDWARALDPVLQAFVDASEGRVDRVHWQSLYKRDDKSGGPYITGWIQVFFPYVVERRWVEDPTHPRGRRAERGLCPNPFLGSWRGDLDGSWASGLTSEALPTAVSAVPFAWRLPLMGLTREMSWLGGFAGVHQAPDTGAVRPKLAWGVRRR